MQEQTANMADDPLLRARCSLEGLAIGDAFGGAFFGVSQGRSLVEQRALPAPPWHYSDDTLMALSVYEVLRLHGGVNQQALAESFAAHYDMYRGYGPSMQRVLRAIGEGQPWRQVAQGYSRGRVPTGMGRQCGLRR